MANYGDYVLYVALLDYSMRPPGSTRLYRGMISAQVSLYDVSLPERQAEVWRGSDIHVMYPSASQIGRLGLDDRMIRYQTHTLFAVTLVKKFYKHKVPK